MSKMTEAEIRTHFRNWRDAWQARREIQIKLCESDVAFSAATRALSRAITQAKKIGLLEPKEALILRRHLLEKKTLGEVARGFGVTTERIRIIEAKAYAKLLFFDDTQDGS